MKRKQLFFFSLVGLRLVHFYPELPPRLVGSILSRSNQRACGYNVGTKGRATGRQWRSFARRTAWLSSAGEPASNWSAVLICSGRAWCWSAAPRTARCSPKPNTVSNVHMRLAFCNDLPTSSFDHLQLNEFT